MRKAFYLIAPALLGLSLSSSVIVSDSPLSNLGIEPEIKVVHAATNDEIVQYVPNYDHVRALIFYAVNQLRAQNHLQSLHYNQTISTNWSNQIITQNANAGTLNHDMTDERQAMANIGYYFFGENLAMTPIGVAIRVGDQNLNPITSDEELAIGLVSQYYEDASVADFGHRKNLLDPWFSQLGIAFTQRTDTDGITRVYNSLDFAGVSTPQTNDAINQYVAYTTATGLDETDWPTQYQPLDETNIDSQSGMYGVVNYNPGSGLSQEMSGLILWNGYGDSRSFSGRRLDNGSAWKITNAQTDSSGHLWYEVGNNQWIDSAYVNVYDW